MGSVVDYEECNQCQGVKFIDYNYSTGEEYGFCQRCGTVSNIVMKRNENGVVILDENKVPIAEHVFRLGYGSCSITCKEGMGRVGVFSEPITEKTIELFRKDLMNPNVDLNESFLASWKDGKQTLLAGSRVPIYHRLSFDEWEKEMIENSKA